MNENEKKLALINVLGIEIIGIILCYLALKNNNGSDLSVFMWIYVGFAIFIEWKIGWLKWIIKISDTIGKLITPLFYFISGLGYILSIVCGLLVTLGGIYISSAYFVFTFPIYALYCMYKKDFSDIMIYKGNINQPEDAKEANGETINNEVTNTENISGNINLKKTRILPR